MLITKHTAAAIAIVAGTSAHAADPTQPTSERLAGNTLSAVAYVSPSAANVGAGLRRIVLQAYLAPDGTGTFHEWTPSHNAYSAPLPIRWSLSAGRLCLELPAETPLCAKVHIWAQRIAGIGTQPYVMLDGDLRPGNAIVRRR